MNLKTSVIATEVTNLTDARYFAAWGVDAMSFCIDPHHDTFMAAEAIKEIIDWVEGPRYLSYIPSIDIDASVAETHKSIGLDGVMIGAYTDSNAAIDVSPRVYQEYFLTENTQPVEESLLIVKLNAELSQDRQIELLNALAESNEVYVDGIQGKDQLDELLKKTSIKGIVLRGGAEEKVGFKSYDELDELFEYLEED